MSNPNNALGTNAAFGGRTSVNAFNDVLGTFNGPGILSGWACSPSSGLTVTLGGNGAVRDVAIAEDSAGNRTTINNISKSPISVTIDAAPASNSRIDAIVAYIESSPSSNALTDNPDVVNLLVVDGTAASTPTAPNDSAIRTAITADGAAGTTAYYVVLAYITIASGTTDIDTTMIASGGIAGVGSQNIDFATLTTHDESTTTVTLNGTPKTLVSAVIPQAGTYLITTNVRVGVGSIADFLLASITKNGSVLTSGVGNTIERAGNYRGWTAPTYVGSFAANDVVGLNASMYLGGTADTTGQVSICAIKIG